MEKTTAGGWCMGAHAWPSLQWSRETRRRWQLITGALIIVVVIVYFKLSVREHGWYMSHIGSRVACPRRPQTLLGLTELASDVDEVLTRLNVTYFLAYGSLFGALRYGGPCPWDGDVDFGLVKETIQGYPLSRLNAEFSRYGIRVRTDKALNGWWDYRFERPNVSLDGFLFSKLFGIDRMERDPLAGKSWLPGVRLNMFLHDSFAARLVQPPLPRRKFGKKMLYVPREGYELQKYLYGGSWYREYPPLSCRNVSFDYLHHLAEKLYEGGPSKALW